MRNLLPLAGVTALMLAAVVACGKKEEGKAGEKAAVPSSETTTTGATVAARASCNMLTELGTCNEYRGTSLSLEKSICEGFHGKFANKPCPEAGQIGACAMSDGEVKRYYGETLAGEHALSLAEAKSDCESDLVKGKFTPEASAVSAAVAKTDRDPRPAPVAKATAAEVAPATK